MKEQKISDFKALLQSLIADGARQIEVEYDHGELYVSVIQGDIGVGISPCETPEEKDHADAVLAELERTKSIQVGGKTYRLAFNITENFGEPCWLIQVSEKKDKESNK